ncbi:MAG: carboxypeptidase regulatory-like domain-containing protein [bacterium]
MKTHTRWMLIVGLTLLLTTLLFLPLTEARRNKKGSPITTSASDLKAPELSSERRREGYGSWKPKTGSQQGSELKPVVSQAVLSGVSQPVRDLPAQRDAVSATDGEGREINEQNEDIEREAVPGAHPIDGALQKSKGGTSVTPNVIGPPTLVFEGLADTDNGGSLVNPPDTVGAVGPNHYVQAVNNRVRIFNKAGVALTAPFVQSSLFASLYPQIGGICSTNNAGDPIVLYDRMADRWQISQFAFTSSTTPPYHQCIAVSQTSDPTGAYYVYDFVLPGNQFPDYPKLGTWPDAYYMSTREFTFGGSFAGEGAVAFDRKKMLVGDPTAAGLVFDLGSLSLSSSGMLPTDFDGITPPPAGAPNVFAIYTSATFGDPGDAIRLFNFHADFTTPANSTFLERVGSPLAVAAFDPRNPTGRTDIEQSGTAADNVDAIGDRLMYRLAYRNRGGVESLVTTHTVNVSGVDPTSSATLYQAAPRYYELRKLTPGGQYTVYDQATFAPDPINGATGNNRWMGSAAIDNSGNLAMGYSLSSTTLVPAIRYGGRSAAFLGGLDEGEATMFAGIGTQSGSGNRWGDYSDLTVDPTDDCTFWYTNEYYPAGNTTFNWKTKVGKFTVSTCTAPQQGTLSGNVTDCLSGLPLGRVQVDVSGGPSSGFSSATIANGNYSMQLAPGSYNVTFSGRSCAVAGPFVVIVTNGGFTTLSTCMTGAPRVGFVSAAVSGGDGNGVIDRNECTTLNVTVSNPGCAPLTGATAVLSSSTAGVTITQANSAYPNIPVDGSSTNTTPFQINTSAAFVCGTPINFTLTVTSPQGTFPVNFSMPSCTIAGSGSIVNTDATQTGRMARNGVVSSCAAPKATPALQDSVVRHFDQYSFTNSGATTACVTFSVSNTCANNLFAATYLGSYNPASVLANYHSDPGLSGSPMTWTANVAAGQTIVLVIHEVTANAGCAGYTFAVSGLPTNGGGACPVSIVNAAASTLTSESCTPANNAIDPGEQVTVDLALTNIGGVSTTNLVATLQSTGGVIAPSGPQNYGAIPSGGTVTRSFTFSARGICGNNITPTLQLQDGANNLGTVSYSFTLGTLSAPVTNTYSSGNIAVPIADLTTVDVPIAVADTGILSDVNAKIRIDHTFDGDLTISLVHPDGTVIALSSGRGGAGDNFGTGTNDCSGVHTVFDDSAATAISAGAAPFAGSFRPDVALSALNGKPSNGIWKLRVADGFAGDTGTIGCVQLELTRQNRVCCSDPTAAPANISGKVTDAAGNPVAGVTMNLSGARTARAITDSNGNYSFTNNNTDSFYTVTPALINYHFGPESRSFSLLANMTDAVFTAMPDAAIVGNAIDSPGFFVRQNYLDFLGREPDESGFNFWSDQILSCGNDAACIERRTINVSAAYFLSIEFQQTGGLVDGLYRASYGRRPLYAEFMPDTGTVARNVVVGRADWAQTLEANKQAFVNAWVERPAFRAAYDGLANGAFVDTLIAHAGAGFNGDRVALVNGLNDGSLTRAAVLRQIVENEGFRNAKRNETFVMMEYFGYLRRDPDESGYAFWLNKLNQFNGNFEQAEMVKAFLVSGEYRARFAQ